MLNRALDFKRAGLFRAIPWRVICVVLIALPLLAACTADAGRMVVSSEGPPLAFPAAWLHSLCLRNVGGGETWNMLSQAGVVEDAAFHEALQKTLTQNQLLAASNGCKYNLDVDILGISQPGEGMFVTSVQTISHVNYKIYDANQRPVFVDTVSASYTEGFSPLPAVARVQHSAEGAVRENFEQFLRHLAAKLPTAA